MVTMLLGVVPLKGQVTSVIIPANTSTGSLEKNVLFYADKRYQVSQQGPTIPLPALFDGSFRPTAPAAAPTPSAPLVILIENLPFLNTQTGAWVGWSTRGWQAIDFKIEGYNAYNEINTWVNMADVTGNTKQHYMIKMPKGSFTKLRFTFYTAAGSEGRMQLSELFYIHPEAVDAYEGMMVKYNASGNVGIGTSNPQAKLAVEGNILAKEVKVKTNISVPDYVFEPDYELSTLAEIEAFVKEHRHLPEIPSAADIKQDGLDLAEMNLLLLKKVEELTLHLIEKEKEIRGFEARIKSLECRNQMESYMQKQHN